MYYWYLLSVVYEFKMGTEGREIKMPQSGRDEQSKLLRNLEDAGCDETLIREFMQCGKEENSSRQERLLKVHRRNLLGSLHVCQSQIDCLDYLLYQMQKEKKK